LLQVVLLGLLLLVLLFLLRTLLCLPHLFL
jgi:hypothetical protein